MMHIKETIKNYVEYMKKIHSIEKQIKCLEEEKRTLENTPPNSFWVDAIIKPIAEAMTERLPDRYHAVLGPFGLSSEVSIHFYKKDIPEKELFEGDNCLSISFRPTDLDNGKISVVNDKMFTDEWEDDTVGAMNGLNNPTVVMKPDIEWLMHWLITQNRDRINDTTLILAYG